MFCGMLTTAKDSHVGTPVCLDWADANLVLDAMAIIDAISCCSCRVEDCKCNSCLAFFAAAAASVELMTAKFFRTIPVGHNDVHHIKTPSLHEA